MTPDLPEAKEGRCGWTGDDPLMIEYHDREWGVPLHDDRRHFEFILLDGAQAGLSWRTVLHKRERYREVFDGFDPGIIRNRLKIESAVRNARAFLELQEAEGSFDGWIWRFVDGEPRVNCWKTLSEVPARTPQSDAMSEALKERGFNFVGSTICYAYMQAAGMVNDHLVGCYRRAEVQSG